MLFVLFVQMWRTKWMKQRGMQQVKLFHIFLISDYLKVGKWGQMCLFCSGAKDICSVMWQTCFPYGDHIIGWKIPPNFRWCLDGRDEYETQHTMWSKRHSIVMACRAYEVGIVMAETALRFLKLLWSNFKSFEIKRAKTLFIPVLQHTRNTPQGSCWATFDLTRNSGLWKKLVYIYIYMLVCFLKHPSSWFLEKKTFRFFAMSTSNGKTNYLPQSQSTTGCTPMSSCFWNLGIITGFLHVSTKITNTCEEITSTDGKLVVWVPVVWDSRRIPK